MASILKVDTITGVTTAGSIAITGEGNSATTNAFNNINYANVWTVYTTAGRNAIRNDSRDATDTLAVEVNNLSGSNVDHATNGTSHGDLA